MKATPFSLGYRMPAEWEKHDATWVSWPKDPGTFPGGALSRVEAAYAEMVKALSQGEEVRVLIDDGAAESRARSILTEADDVTYHRIKTVDVWVRDYAPIYVKGGRLAVTKWSFNAWGEKYEDLKRDDESGRRIAVSTGLKVFEPGVVLEGGSIDVDGEGTLITTEQCLLNPNRNPKLGRAGVERALAEYLGARRVVWLDSGIEGDDTDGHVDEVARFVAPGKVAVAVEPDPEDPNHAALDRNRLILEGSKDVSGRRFELTALPMPKRLDSPDGRLPASHANFYVGNSSVIVPTFGGESDAEAVRTINGLFPGREAVGVDCRALVYGLGTVHCVTQQVPAL
jgi:agmatine deiminase